MKKLLLVGDAGTPTGFEKVLRYVCEHLHATGKYDMTIRGIGYYPDAASQKYPCEVKGVGGTASDPIGATKFGDWIKEDKPDVVWTVQDLWNILGFCLSKPRDLPLVAYFPVDTPNMSFGNAWALGAITEAVSYTRFGTQEVAAGIRMAVDILAKGRSDLADEKLEWLESQRLNKSLFGRLDRYVRYQNPGGFNIVPHGLDLGVYQPRDKAYARKDLQLPEKGFIIGYVSTNQFRKRQDLAIRAFAKHLQEHSDSWLVLHCSHDMGQAWDLAQLAHLYGIRDRVILTHRTLGELSEDQLCTLYNAMDLHINTSGGEGWGLTSFESAGCAVPQLVPDWSATRELWTGHAELLPVADYRIEPRLGINTAHAVVSVAETARLLTSYATNPDKCLEYGTKARNYALAQPPWSAVGDAFDRIIQNALNEPAPAAYSLNDLIRLRDGTAQCEVASWL